MPKCAVANILGHDGRTIQGQIEFTALGSLARLPMTMVSQLGYGEGNGEGMPVAFG